MKSILKSAILLFSGVAILASPAMAVVTFNSGDLYVAFYQVNGSNVVQPNTYVFDLGQSSLFRENALNNVSVSTVNTGLASNNINTDLVSAFGANWANDSTVRWMVVGGVAPADSALSGDNARTSYESRSRSSLTLEAGPGSTYNNGLALSSGNSGTLSTQFSTFRDGVNGATQTTGDNAAGAIIATSQPNTVDEFLPPEDSTFFGISIDPRQTFNTGLITGSNVEGALDIYRVLHTTAGADLTAGQSAGNATTRVGQFIGTLTIDSLGNLGIGEISAVPEPSGALALGVIGSIAGLGYRSRRAKKIA